jgi:alpha-L-fucosidase
LQPQVLVSYKQGLLGTEDFFAPEHKAVENPSGKPMEICSTLQEKSWGYNAQARHISTDEAWAKLAAASTARANLLLNTGPRLDGSIPQDHVRVLRALGQRIRADGWPAPGVSAAPPKTKQDKTTAPPQ